MADLQVSGARKAAIALVAMGEDASSALLKHLQEHEIERIMREIAALDSVSSALNEQVLGELRRLALAGISITAGGLDQAKRLLSKAVTADQGKRILDRIVQTNQAQAGFTALEKANPQQLAKFVSGEHPQTIALVIAHLTPENAAQVLSQLPEDLRTDVVTRLAGLQDIPPDVITHISHVIDQRMRALAGPRREQRGGVRAVAEVFNKLDRQVSKAALERLEAASPELAVAVRNSMFVFDDLVNIDEAGIREIVNRVDKRALTIALKGSSDAIRQLFFQNMSKRAGDLMKEEMESLGATKLKEVEKAQQEVVAVARALEEEGAISSAGGGAGEAYVA
jgi:flagellar motor switch protein FliG